MSYVVKCEHLYNPCITHPGHLDDTYILYPCVWTIGLTQVDEMCGVNIGCLSCTCLDFKFSNMKVYSPIHVCIQDAINEVHH